MFEEILTQIQSLTPALVLTLGLIIGLKHAFEPDHIAAVTTQISIQKKQFSVTKTENQGRNHQIITNWSNLGGWAYYHSYFDWITSVCFIN